MKTRVYVMVLIAISATMLILGASSTSVFADPCSATISYPQIPLQNGNSNVPLIVPISASCSQYYGGQLYATGTAYDATSNTGLGSASTVLSSVNGGTEFNGQLSFNLLPTSPTDTVQVSVSIYSSQGGTQLTATNQTFQANTGAQPPLQEPVEQITTTTTVTEGQYPYANPYPTAYPLPYQPNQSQYYQPQFQDQYQGHHSHSPYYFAQRSNNTLFDYAVIIAIIAAVIIATVGLVLVARRPQRPQPVWYPVPPAPPPSR